MFRVNHKDTKTTSLTSLGCLCCKLGAGLTPCSSVSIFNFEHVIETCSENVREKKPCKTSV